VDPLERDDPSQVGGYTLLGRLGSGGMGLVFLAEGPDGEQVAVKVVRPDLARQEDFRLRFAREVTAARSVDGRYTAHVVAADPEADLPWMATTYIPGPSLADAVNDQGPLTAAAVRVLAGALARGLMAIHACGLVHRDLKPPNIILANEGPRIIDFGIAKGATNTTITPAGAIIGSFRYMSPEHLGHAEVTAASDIFSLGGVLTFAATGHGPFDASDDTAIVGRVLTVSPDLHDVPDSLREVISLCLAKEPGNRPGPAELLDLLSDAEAERAEREKTRPVAVVTPGRVQGETTTPFPGVDRVADLRHTGDVELVAFSPDGQFLAVGEHGRVVCLWHTATWRSAVPEARLTAPGEPGGSSFSQLVFAPDSRTVLAALVNEPGLWRLKAGSGEILPSTSLPRRFSVSGGAPRISPDGSLVADEQSGRFFVLWDLAARRPVPVVLGSGRWERRHAWKAAAFSADISHFAAVDTTDQVHLWEAATGRKTAVLRRLPLPRSYRGFQVQDVAVARQGRQVAACGELAFTLREPATTYWWDLDGGVNVKPRQLVRNAVSSAPVFSPDGVRLALLTYDADDDAADPGQVLRVWDTAARTAVDVPAGELTVSGLSQLMFSPDGRLLMTVGGRDLILWDARAAIPVPVAVHRAAAGSEFASAAFSADGRFLATAEGKTARIWRVPLRLNGT
jgi:WD40 repeat protein